MNMICYVREESLRYLDSFVNRFGGVLDYKPFNSGGGAWVSISFKVDDGSYRTFNAALRISNQPFF